MKNLSLSHKIIIALIAIAFILRLPIILERYINPDEFEHIHAIRCVCHGMLPYRDFFEHHTPLLYFLLSPIYPLSGDNTSTIFLLRIFMLIFAFGILYLTYTLSRLLYDSTVALYAVFFLSYETVFLDRTIEVRPDVPAVFFCIFAMIFLISAVGNGKRDTERIKYSALSGMMLAAAFLFTQKTFFIAAGIFLSLLLLRLTKKHFHILLWFGIGLAGPVGIITLYFLFNGAIDDFIYRNFLMNMSWQQIVPPERFLKIFFTKDTFFTIFGLAGLIIATLRSFKKKERSYTNLIPLFSTYCAILGIFIIPVPYTQYFLFFIPLMAMYCGVSLRGLTKYKIFHNNKNPLPALILLLCVVMLPLKHELDQFMASGYSNKKQLKEISFILKNTNAGDSVFEGWRGVGAFRDHAYYYYFLHGEICHMLTDKELSTDIVEALQKKKPKFVIYDSNMRTLSPDVTDYIMKNYASTEASDIYILKNQTQ